jgi:hypothetical protein
MKIDLTSFAIVVLAKAHNPTVLNPDFLRYNGITDDGYTPVDVVCTAPIAHVVYREKMSVVAEFDSVQFIDEDRVRIPFDSPIPKMAIKYMDVLPHVRYNAVGVNFAGHFSKRDTAPSMARLYNLSFIKERFIKEGPWFSPESGITGIGINLTYAQGGIKSTVEISTIDIIAPQETVTPIDAGDGSAAASSCRTPVISFKANYHIDTDEGDILKIKSFIMDWQKIFQKFTEFVEGTCLPD